MISSLCVSAQVALASSGNLDAAAEPFAKACEFQPEERNNW